MAQGILATNALLKTQGRTTFARCSCCHKAVETLNHLVGHCPEPRVRAVRNSLIQHVHNLLAELCKHSKVRQLETQLKAIWSLETIKEACKETNGSAMVGGITEGEKWLGLSTSIKRDDPCGGLHSGQVTTFNNNSANEDHSWGVLWEGNEKTIEYDYKTLKTITNQKDWIAPSKLSETPPLDLIVNATLRNRTKQLFGAGPSALWKGMFPNAWFRMLTEAGINDRTINKTVLRSPNSHHGWTTSNLENQERHETQQACPRKRSVAYRQGLPSNEPPQN